MLSLQHIRRQMMGRPASALIGVMLFAALALRALIPAGYMPSSGHLFQLELCWDGVPAPRWPAAPLAHAAHGGPADHSAAASHDAFGNHLDGNSALAAGAHASDTAHADHFAHANPQSQLSHDAHGDGASPAPLHDSPSSHSSAQPEHCLFGAAFGAGPLPYIAAPPAALTATAPYQFENTPPHLSTRKHRNQQPRAPPALS